MVNNMETYEIRAKTFSGTPQEPRKVGIPSWDALLADLARVIREDGLYPEEMPLECFEIY